MELTNFVALAALAGVAGVVTSSTRTFMKACETPVRRDSKDPLPSVSLVVSCKSAPPHLREVLETLADQDYPEYRTVFTVASTSGPAYAVATEVASRFPRAETFVAGYSNCCSEKTYNLSQAIANTPEADVYAFADSDIQIDRHWLKAIVIPLGDKGVGLTTAGKVPWVTSFPAVYIEAFIRLVFACQLLAFSMPSLVLAWGGSMAVRRDVMERLRILELWRRTVDDDISISQAVRNEGLRIHFVPIFVPTRVPVRELGQAFEWAIRQLQYLWLYYKPAWLMCSFLTIAPTVLGFGALSWFLLSLGYPGQGLVTRCGLLYMMVHMSLVGRVLWSVNYVTHDQAGRGERFPVAQALLSPISVTLVAAVCVISMVRRTMVWGGVIYKLRSPEDIDVISRHGLDLAPSWDAEAEAVELAEA